jgi:hypothetical protein
MLPFESMRKRGFLDAWGKEEKLVEKNYGLSELNTESIPTEAINSIKENINNNFSAQNVLDGQQKELDNMNNKAYRTLACTLLLKFDFANISSCEKSMLELTDHTKQTARFVMPNEWLEVHTEQTYLEPLYNMATKLIKNYESKTLPPEDFFSSLLNEFKKSGLSNQQAIEHSWNVVAVISSAGANYVDRAIDFEVDLNKTAFVTMRILSKIRPLFNFWGRGTGSYYSLPKSVKINCDNGKPYHFWMSAYLTWKSHQMGYSKIGSAAATYSIFKFYTYLSKSGFRQPHNAFSLDSFHGYNNIQRIDMVYSAAGIKFALNFIDNKVDQPIDIDKAVIEIFKVSQDSAPVEEFEAQKMLMGLRKKPSYFKWVNWLGSDSPFESFDLGNE